MNLDIMTKERQELLLSLLRGTSKAVVVGHKNPDGDAVGACLAWARFLRAAFGAEAAVILPDSWPEYLSWMPGGRTVINYESRGEEADGLIAAADSMFCLDFNGLSRTGAMAPALASSAARRIMMDHHPGPAMETAFAVSDSGATSTCEVVFRVVRQLGFLDGMDAEWAAAVYCGMMTDTGGFTYNSSRPEIYRIIGELLAMGIDKDRIYRLVYNNFSHWAVRFRGYVMSRKLNVYSDLGASYFAITRKEMEDFHFAKGDAEGLVNVPLTIKGMRLSISLREDDRADNLIWVSVRSVDDFPANEVAEKFFSGGGHLNAAGGHLDCTMEEAVETAKRAIKAFSDRLKI